MRRRLAVLAAVPLLLAAACGTDVKSDAGPTAASTGAAPTVSGEPGAKPTVTFPSGKPADTSSFKVVKEGEGTPVKLGDSVVVHLTVYTWDGKANAKTGSTYDAGAPELMPLTAELPKVVQNAFAGAKPGGRFYAVIAADSYTKEQLDQAKAQGVPTGIAQVFVVDLLGAPTVKAATGKAVDPHIDGIKLVNPGGEKAPTLTTKTGEKASKKLIAETVIKGSGPEVKKGQAVLVQYVGKIWGSDVEFDSSWSKGGKPVLFQIGEGKVIKGWDQGLVGRPVGSRVLLSIPPDLGYGKAGQGDQIKGTDTLVFAVDLLAAY